MNGYDTPPMTDATRQEEDAAMLRAFLADRDAPCPRCGYNLRAASSNRCSECGLVVRLGIHATEPLIVWWIATLVPMALSAGVGLLFVVLMLGRSGPPPSRYWWVMFPAIAAIPAVAAFVATRRRFIRLAVASQRLAAIVTAVAAVAIFIGLAYIR